MIHPGEYNKIQNWDYAGLVKAFDKQGTMKSWSTAVRTERELIAAMEKAQNETSTLCFVEVMLAAGDCTPEMKQWGKVVARENMRPF